MTPTDTISAWLGEGFNDSPVRVHASNGSRVCSDADIAEINRVGPERFLEQNQQADREVPEPPVDVDMERAIREREEQEDHRIAELVGDLKLNEAVDDPHRMAREHIKRFCQHRDGVTVRFWRNEPQVYNGRRYRTVSAQEHAASLTQTAKILMDEAHVKELLNPKDEKKPPVLRRVTSRMVSDMSHAFTSLTIVPSEIDQPSFLDGPSPYPANEIVAFNDSLIHLPSYLAGRPYRIPHTPRLFSSNVLDFDFNANAPKPSQFLRFLDQLWPDDIESISTLQEVVGYLLSGETRLQKIFMLLGPRRAGKGTLARIIRALLGLGNVAGPTLSSLGGTFGLWPLLGKTLAIINDARLSNRNDISVIVERLLSISGEDAIGVERKYLPSLIAKLPTRFLIVTNELPRLGDSSGALTGRIILLRLTNSFYGQEDPHLTDRLMTELPGILLWGLSGWQRLQERGRFLQPAASAELLQDLEDLSSPIGVFVRECCEVGPTFDVAIDNIFERWQQWCCANGRREPGIKQVFGRDLQAAYPAIQTKQHRDGDIRYRAYEGIRLKSF